CAQGNDPAMSHNANLFTPRARRLAPGLAKTSKPAGESSSLRGLMNLFRCGQLEAGQVEGSVMKVAVLHLHPMRQQAAIHSAVIRQVHLAGIFVLLQAQFKTEQFRVAPGKKPLGEKRPQASVQHLGIDAQIAEAGRWLAVCGRWVEWLIAAVSKLA